MVVWNPPRRPNLRLHPLRWAIGRWRRHSWPRRCRAKRAIPCKADRGASMRKPVARIVRIGMADRPGEHSDSEPRDPLVPAAMSTPIHCDPVRVARRRPFRDGVNRFAGIANNDIDQCHDRRSAMHRGAAQQDPGLRPCSGDIHHRTIKGPDQRVIRKRGARDALRDSARSHAPGLDQDSPLLG